MKSTKEQITEYLKEKTGQMDLSNIDEFTTNEIAERLHISRSVASQYLNELVESGEIFKVKSRPVYFFEKATLESKYAVSVKGCDFLDVTDMLEYITANGQISNVFESLIGHDGSLKRIIRQSTEIFDYPPNGLPLLIYGNEGTGRKLLADLICRNSGINGRIVTKQTFIIRTEVAENDSRWIEKIRTMIEEHSETGAAVILSRFEKINAQLEEYLVSFFENISSENKVHFIFISTQRPDEYLHSSLSKNIPLLIHMRDYDERPKEEREGIVMELFRREEKVLNASILISSNVLRTLASSKYADNIQGLTRVIKLICAQASLSMADGVIKVHTYDMPSAQLENIQIIADDVIYLSCDKYTIGKEVDQYLDFFNSVLALFDDQETSVIITKFSELYSSIEENLIFTNNTMDQTLQGMEVTVSNIINAIIQKRFIVIPGNFSFVLAKFLYIYHEYHGRFARWEEDHKNALTRTIDKLQKEFISETIIVDEINTLVENNLEEKLPGILRIVAELVLFRYNSDLNKRKIFGIIICHGYSTASSIAGAVNSLIGSYVFDSIDMPLSTTVNEVKEALKDRLQRMNRFADVVIMVDMGSLEEIGGDTVVTSSRNVAMINNVTTKMALNIGYHIKNGDSINRIFDDAEDEYKVEHTVIHGRKTDTILFTSESGLQTAQRMEDLFRDSLPEEINVTMQIIQNEKLVNGNISEIIENGNLLFVIGTEDPGVSGITFIPLESLITTGCMDIISQKLSGYMSEENVAQMIVNIRRNFTLINVVNYLTILNPQPLLDYTTVAVENLQKRTNTELEGKRLVGIYIHICVLVERLVTKSGVIKDDSATKSFVDEHTEFIGNVRDSFKQISDHYRIEIPDSEMMYLYSFMAVENQ